MATVELDKVEKRFGEVVALEPVDLAIRSGEFLAILGPSGCGKSTTLFLLAGIYAPSAGEIRFDGVRINEIEAKDRNVGIVFQSYALYPHMTVAQNIGFPLRLKRVPIDESKRRVEAIARLVRVEELLDRKPAQLSGGQQQRVALARALVKEPQLLLLDEPLSNLDAGLRLAMRGEIRRLQRELGVTTVLVTHDQIEAVTMADRIVCMSKGRIEQIGTADDLYARPASLFVASFLGSPPINLVEGTAEDGAVRLGERSFAANGSGPLPQRVVVGIRPEAIRLGEGPIRGRILDGEPHGREWIWLVESEVGALRVVEPGAAPRHRAGEQVVLGWSESLLFDAADERRLQMPGPVPS
ncbi:MAG: ABC transporter ATP-binding protein [Geminicoccaceae bacterium]|nr:ABC transporter ATP-binding protein [Geminicoccaceae bacterium]MCX8101030.1 ABC transporter ATP-binding protein [Geminicoccaceae bacterium]MDW8370654.1 ABC transporter ATP-binding protein [Geminicoccaceae bacterium]